VIPRRKACEAKDVDVFSFVGFLLVRKIKSQNTRSVPQRATFPEAEKTAMSLAKQVEEIEKNLKRLSMDLSDAQERAASPHHTDVRFSFASSPSIFLLPTLLKLGKSGKEGSR